jgi:integrase
VASVLEPLWRTRTETASRLRGRIEAVLDWAAVRGHRSGDNPARWRGNLDKLLPPRSKVQRARHHPALPYGEVPAFVAELREQDGIAALALRFVILTACRTGEAIGARWSEMDGDTWTVPGERMKSGRPHRVPLSAEAVAVLDAVRGLDAAFVFPGGRRGKPLSNAAMTALLKRMGHGAITVHGFRSSFRDWAAEQTAFPREVAEAALAHVLADKVEAAYRRSDLFERRRRLMDAWAGYLATPRPAGAVVPIAGAR